MTLSIRTKLFLALLGTGTLVAVAMLAFMAWSFERGLVELVQGREQRQIATIAERVRLWVRRWFAHDGLLNPDDIADMLSWGIGGFSLHTSVRIAGHDRARLERLLRGCEKTPNPRQRSEKLYFETT